MVANVAQHPGEGHFLPYHRGRGRIVAVFDEAHVAGHIDLRGAVTLARHQARFAVVALDETLFVLDGPGGTHLRAGPAEAAARVGEGCTLTGVDVGLFALLLVVEHPDFAEFPARPHAAPAEHALVGIVDEQRVAGVERQQLGAPLDPRLLHAQILLERLQLAVEVLLADAAVDGMSGQQQLHG